MLSFCVSSYAFAEPFVVQGQLRDNGLVANAQYDFEFELWDAAVNGNQIGTTLTANDLDVVAGVFTAEVDFGSVFTGSPFWVETRIRLGSSTGAYSSLPDRILIGSTPQAQHASTADTLLNPQWTEAPGILWYGSGTDQVFINRSSEVVVGEVFGVQNDGGFSGLVVSSPSNSSQPYIALAANNTVDAYQWYDGSTDSWVFWKSGAQRFYLDSNNDFIVNEKLTAESVNVTDKIVAGSYEYALPFVKTTFVSAGKFSINSGFLRTVQNEPIPTAQHNSSVQGGLTGDLDLPEGAIIEGFDAWLLDRTTFDDFAFSVIAESHFTGAKTVLVQTTTSGSNTNVQLISATASSQHVVDNSLFSYKFYADAVDGTWGSSNTMGVRGALLKYSVTSPE